MQTQFVQIHTLTSYGAALLNRDDAGFAKRIPFGGASRTRVSSQCLKRHWRTNTGPQGLGELDVPGSVRSRVTFERYVVQPLVAEGLDESAVRAVTAAYMAELLGESGKAREAKKSAAEEAEDGGTDQATVLKTGQITILGRPEIAFICEEVRTVCEEVGQEFDGAESSKQLKKAEKEARDAVKARLKGDAKQNLRALEQAAGLDAALFGRMVTSDILTRLDAAVHVAHAFTVHEEAAESDYFSAVDDLLQGEAGELGSGHINSSELTTGLFYGYVVVDVPQLLSNLNGCPRSEADQADRALSADVVGRLVQLIATVSPGAKRGSTAPYANAHLVLIETGPAQPRTLANAFLAPVAMRPDPIANTYRALNIHLRDLDSMYGAPAHRRFAAMGAVESLVEGVQADRCVSLSELSSWAADAIRNG